MIKLTRIDDRLLHGQVALTWVPALGADCILIANDKVAKINAAWDRIKGLSRSKQVEAIFKDDQYRQLYLNWALPKAKKNHDPEGLQFLKAVAEGKMSKKDIFEKFIKNNDVNVSGALQKKIATGFQSKKAVDFSPVVTEVSGLVADSGDFAPNKGFVDLMNEKNAPKKPAPAPKKGK